MKLSSLVVKRFDPFHIDIVAPLNWSETDFQDIQLLFDRQSIKLKGYYPHMGYIWFLFEATKKGLTGITLICSRLDINHCVLVTAE